MASGSGDDEDGVDQRHELFLREIECMDEYWGPAFSHATMTDSITDTERHLLTELEGPDASRVALVLRTIYDGEEHGRFLEKLSLRITNHERDIEKMCNHYYHGFIDSVHDLLTVREQASRLREQVTRVDSDVQESLQQVVGRSEELVKARKVSSHICEAIETLSTCLPVLRTHAKLLSQIQEKRYYAALKTLEQLEHTSLPRVADYKFTEEMRRSILKLREDIKQAAMGEIKDFLEEVRRMSPRIGQVTMRQFTVYRNGLETAVAASAAHTASEITVAPPAPLTASSELGDLEASSEALKDEEAELGPEDLVDFCPVLRCLHIHTVLGEREQFYTYYRTQRQEQARLALQPPHNMHESASCFRQYVQAVLGFFVVEETLAHTAPGLVDKPYLLGMWQMAQGKIINNIRNQASYITDTRLMLDIKHILMLFACTLQSYGYPVTCIHELLLEVKDHYNEVLMTKWLQVRASRLVFREIFEDDNYHPISVADAGEYSDIATVFPYHDAALEAQPFPKQFPFSLMVPKVYREVKNFASACLDFYEDLPISESSKEGMVRRSTNLLLTRTLSGTWTSHGPSQVRGPPHPLVPPTVHARYCCLASLIKRPGLGLLQLIQITINTLHLEEANSLLESYVSRLVGANTNKNSGVVMLGSLGTKVPVTLGNLQAKAMFKDIRGEAEEQIYAALLHKLDEFLELSSYNWMLLEPSGHSSSFVADLIAFLNSTFAAFTNLPVRVAGTACMSACQHIARSLQALLLADNVRQLSLPALEQLSLDVLQCEQFAAGEPVPGLEEGALVMCFADLRQLLDLLLTEDWSTYCSEYGRSDAKFLRVSPATAASLVEKLLEGEKKGVFSRLKRSDKKKLLETVLRQLRHIQQAQHA
ncbi:Exocyst complex component EXOC6/Sec15 [Trinorchestia longiramus]|nr:Exocyst complex component EXOC6/Sec15 [Trinorchestia longiramus]